MTDKAYILARKQERIYSYDDIAEWLHYNPQTGIITWKKRRGQRGKVGVMAGCKTGNGYINIRIFNRLFLAHRIAWLLYYKDWPIGLIDHIDGDKVNNSIQNLRITTNRRNVLNKTIHRNGRLFGVRKSRNRCVTDFRHNGIRYHLGVYDSAEEAHSVYKSILNSADRDAAILEIRQRLPKASSNYRSMKV